MKKKKEKGLKYKIVDVTGKITVKSKEKMSTYQMIKLLEPYIDKSFGVRK